MAAQSIEWLDPAVLVGLLLEQATEHALVIIDTSGTIRHWLAAAETVFGYTAAEVNGRPHSMLFTPEDVAKTAPEKELVIANQGAPAEDDRWMVRKDGLRIWVTGVLQALRDDNNNIIAYGKIIRNRTDLKGHISALEHEITGLKSAEERKNKFISTLAHELRNPLGSLVAASELLKQEIDESDKGRFTLALIDRQLEAIRRLVDDLLDITRLNVGKVQLELREENLADIIRAAVETCQPRIDERTHEVHLILGNEPVFVQADALRLQQVFVNLIENAVKYTKHGGTIWVKLLVDGHEAVIKVEDTGIGISPEVLPRIFDLFTQAEFAKAQSGQGLGIGLSVVKDITRLHGGSVQVRSDGIGKGSEFTVRLPLAGVDQTRPDNPAPNSTRHPL
jgi:PAS domain S-box-containing protein